MKKFLMIVSLIFMSVLLVSCSNETSSVVTTEDKRDVSISELIEYNKKVQAEKDEEEKLIDEYVKKCVDDFTGSHYYSPRMIITIAVEKPINDYNTKFNGEKPIYDYVIRVYGNEYCDIYLCSNGEIQKYVSIDLLKITKGGTN